MYPQYGLDYICRLFGKTRQGWYEQCEHKENQALAGAIVIKLVKEIREKLPRLGTRKLLHKLQPRLEEHGIEIGRDRLYDLLGFHGLLLRYRRRKPYTTNSRHHYKKYPNLIRDMVLTGPEQLWVSDITYLSLGDGFCYLSIVTDAYSRKIVGWELHLTLAAEGAIRALVMAINGLKIKRYLIHHSDRGVQYCCADYVRTLEHFNIAISMTENGDPYENPVAERVNGILKNELLLNKKFASFDEAQQVVAHAIEMYNEERPHLSCDMLTPAQAHEQSGILRKRWKRKSTI